MIPASGRSVLSERPVDGQGSDNTPPSPVTTVYIASSERLATPTSQTVDLHSRSVSPLVEQALPTVEVKEGSENLALSLETIGPLGQNESQQRQLTAMTMACRSGNIDELSKLIEQAPDELLLHDPLGQTPLHYTQISQNIECIKQIVKSKPETLFRKNSAGFTPIHLFAANGTLNCLIAALECLDTQAPAICKALEATGPKSEGGQTPLHMAVLNQCNDCTDYLIHKFPECLIFPNAVEDTAVHLAAAKGHVDILAKMLQTNQGVEALKIEGEGNYSPLHWAAVYQHHECVRLITHTCPEAIALKDSMKDSPIQLAVSNGDSESLKIMLTELEDSTVLLEKNDFGGTPLHTAVDIGSLECMRLIMDKEPNTALSKNIHKNTPVHCSCASNNASALDIFFKYYAGIRALTVNGEHGLTPLQRAIFENSLDCIHIILKQYPAALNVENQNHKPLQWAAMQGCDDAVQLIANEFPDALVAQNMSGETVLSVASTYGRTSIVEFILSCPEGRSSLLMTDQIGETPLHKAAQWNRLACCRILIEQSPVALLTANNNDFTPLHLSAIVGHKEILKLMLDHPEVYKRLTDIDLFSDLSSPFPDCKELISQYRRSQRLPFIPVKTNPPTKKGEPLDQQTSSLYFESITSNQKSGYAKIHDTLCAKLHVDIPWKNTFMNSGQVRKAIHNIENLGVFIRATCYLDEVNGQFYSLGDENSGLQLILSLINLGAKSIQVLVSPPESSTPDQRRKYTKQETELYVKKQKAALKKLAYLFTGINPEAPLPQTIVMNHCKITFQRSENCRAQPGLFLSFLSSREIKYLSGASPDNVLRVLPFRFDKYNEQYTTDHQHGKCNAVSITSPSNSIIPEIELDVKPEWHFYEKEPGQNQKLKGISMHRMLQSQFKHSESLGINTDVERSIIDLCVRAGSNKINLSVIYGIAFDPLSLTDRKTTILGKWLHGVTALNQYEHHNKPSFILVSSLHYQKKELTEAAAANGCTFIDLAYQGSQNLIKNLRQGRLAICSVPLLPKLVFLQLLKSSTLPALVEGANTTSALIKMGHPFQSLLPKGRTPIPQNMGNPLEALKLEAYSYKLAADEIENLILRDIHDKIQSESYDGALERVRLIKNEGRNYPNLKFLWDQHSTPSKTTTVISFFSLLEKAASKPPGQIVRRALLSITIPPSGKAIAEYIHECMDKHSAAWQHFQLMQMHVCLPANDTPLYAIRRLCIDKHLMDLSP